MGFGGVFSGQDGINAGRHCGEATTTSMRYSAGSAGSPETSVQDMTSLGGGGSVAEVPVLSSQYECAGQEKAINHLSPLWGAVEGVLYNQRRALFR